MYPFANVALFKNARVLDKLYTYSIPDALKGEVKVGMRVLVPFGKGNRMEEGLVFSLEQTCSYGSIKSINSLVKDGIYLNEQHIKMVEWLRERYLCTYKEAIQVFLPAGTQLIRHVFYSMTEKGRTERAKALLSFFAGRTQIKNEDWQKEPSSQKKIWIENGWVEKQTFFETGLKEKIQEKFHLVHGYEKNLEHVPSRNVAQIRVVSYLEENGPCFSSEIYKACNCGSVVLESLEKRKIIKRETKKIFRQPAHYEREKKGQVDLNEGQKKAYQKVKDHMDFTSSSVFFLHGVTGSGKTEIYLRWAKDVFYAGKQCFILVPEISLTAQIVSRFVEVFKEQVAVFHSGLTLGERFDQWRAVKKGERKIVLGARSALFAPCDDLGLIILDEAHDDSYKSGAAPRFHGIEVAKHLGKLNKCPVVLGSATLDMGSALAVKNGKYHYISLKSRYKDSPMPKISIVDMREELKMGNRSVFSEQLFSAIGHRLEKKEQTILFLNRKGYATFVACRQCGFSLKCPHCEIALTYYKGEKRACCHYCGYNILVPDSCPSCESGYFKFFGTGTEKLEILTKEAFPHAVIDRLDRQVITQKGQLHSVLNRFEKGETDILVGTQMVTKGLDFKNVTLVGGLSADVLLNLPDFRSPEKTFQTLTQVAGRAGRGSRQGEVIVQTYTPEHYAVQAFEKGDQAGFIKEELALRKAYHYPPFWRLSTILVSGSVEAHVIRTSRQVAHHLKKSIVKNTLKNCLLFGPNPAVYSKMRGKYRWQILLKSPHEEGEAVRSLLQNIKKKSFCVGESSVVIDVEAISTL